MHFALIAPPLRGHMRPLGNLAAELIARGHRATFIHQPEAAAMIGHDGIGFEPVGTGAQPIASWTRPMARIRGLLGLGGVIGGMARFTDMLCREAPAIVERIGADAMIVDQLEPAGGLVAERLSLPFASVASALPMNREMGVPPPFVGWDYDASAAGMKRNRGGWRVTDLLLSGLNRAIARNAQRLGLPAKQRLEDCFSPLLQLSQMVPSIDYPRSELPATFHYTGPLRSRSAGAFQLPPSDGRPLLFCSLGTLQGSRTHLFERVAKSCDQLGLRLIMTLGGAKSIADMRGLPGEPLIYDWVDQQAVLADASLTVCHGGMNTVLDSLAAGVPLVIMPLAFEQSAIAARLRYAGVAEVVPARGGRDTLSAAIRKIRDDPGFRDRAKAVALELAQAGGTARAADLIEQSLALPAARARPAAATMAGAARGDAHDDSRSGSR